MNQKAPGAFSSPFARGMAGGLLGGMLGGMLFGGMAHGTGMGGLGGSGIGLVEILLLALLGYFLYKKFLRPQALVTNKGPAPVFARSMPEAVSVSDFEPDSETVPPQSLVDGVKEIWRVDNEFNPEGFKETAQDLFFKIQAGWTRRETEGLNDFVGQELLNEYAGHFAQMKEQGQINRLENIAVRKVDLMQAGVENGEIFVTVRFTANLLDYTVDEKSGATISGDMHNPIKFEEFWTFAKPVGGSRWKLEGIEH
jgi:predicted lipid-binding transport protein (Tim44 family)